jgi:uncharacterized protein YjbI with pentapeptide repeats
VDQQRKSRWRPTGTQVLWMGIGVVGVFAATVVFGGYYFEWEWTGYPKRTPWDWLDLLIIPVVLALGGYLFNSSQNQATERAAERRAQDDALQAYLDKMSELLIDEQLRSEDDRYADKRITARARTLAVLRQLDDGERKRTILLFLREARLINRKEHPRDGRKINPPIVGLEDADLRNANLRRAKLINTDRNEPISLGGANLEGADLQGADLEGADLGKTNLNKANLSGANLSGANLSGANLSGANLNGAKGWTSRQVAAAEYLEGTTMPDGQILKSDDNPDGPTFEEWLKSKGSGEDGENN